MKTLGTRNSGEVIARPDFVQSVVLTSGIGQAFDTPAGAGNVVFSLNADFWVNYGNTAAAAPAASSTGSSGSEFNPNIRNITSTLACTGISIYSDSAAKGSIAWYHA
jgi:hypothetical protein